MIFFNPADIFSANTKTPWSEEQLLQVEYAVRQNPHAINVHGVETWFIKKIRHPLIQELYLKLAEDKPLSLFIKTGDLSIFYSNNLKLSIQDQAYFRFWKPFFLRRFSQVICQGYQQKELTRLLQLMQIPFELSLEEQDLGFQNLKVLLQDELFNIHQIELEIRVENSLSVTILERLQTLVQVSSLNALPDYFEGLRAAFCKKLVEVAMQIFNKGSHYLLAQDVVELAKQLKVSIKENERLAYWDSTLKEYIQTIDMLRRYAAEIQQHSTQLQYLESLNVEIQQNTISPAVLESKVLPVLNFNGLSELPNRFQFFINDYFNYLRIFATYVWNVFQDRASALDFLYRAGSLPLSADQKALLLRDFGDLETKHLEWRNDSEKLQKEYTIQIGRQHEEAWIKYFIAVVSIGLIGALISKMVLIF